MCASFVKGSFVKAPFVKVLRWHDLLPLRDLVDQKTAPINDSYDLIFGDAALTLGGRSIDTGVTDFSRQQCWVNTEVLDGATPAKQFVTTVFLAAHERAHARWTAYHEEDFYRLDAQGQVVRSAKGEPTFDAMVHQTWNILEDERIERLIGRDYAHLHRYLREGNRHLLAIVPAAGSDNDPSHILTWVLRRRLLTRFGGAEACPLSMQNQQLLAEIEPLLEEAFSCDSSRRVAAIAREILKKLSLEDGSASAFLDPMLSGQVGKRGGGDGAESDGATEEEGRLYGMEGGLGDDVEEMFSGAGYSPEVRRGGKTPSAPYLELLSEVRPYVEPLRHLFQTPPTKRTSVFEESGARLSMRAYRRTPSTPFRVDSPPTRKGTIALSMVIDDSGSMSGKREHQAKLTALLCHEALQGAHRVRAVLAPTGRVVCDRSQGEMSRAYIAGYDSSSGTEYAAVMAKEAEQLIKLGPGYTRYLVLIADGVTGTEDAKRCTELVKRLRRHKVHAIGIGLELPESSSSVFEAIFGTAQYVALQKATELPSRMQAIMRRVARNTQHHGVAS